MMIEDLTHFVLLPDEVLLLRPKGPITHEQLTHLQRTADHALPGRAVLIVSHDTEVMAGRLEQAQAPAAHVPDVEDVAAAQDAILRAYADGKTVWVNDQQQGWFYAHRAANPHRFDFQSDRFAYSLTRPTT